MIQLRLDGSALAALFPEGTEARADLQRAYIAEFVRHNIKPKALGNGVEILIEQAKREAIDSITKDIGIQRGQWGSMVLSPDKRSVVIEEAKSAVRSEVSKAISEQIEASIQKLSGRIEHDIEAAVTRLINSDVEKAVQARLKAIAEQITQ